MASTESEIANLACERIGTEARITSLDDDRNAARALKAVWGIERRATLRTGAFNFSTRRAALAAEVLAPSVVIYPWAYSFLRPALDIRLLEVLDTPRASYQLEGRSILCNSAGPVYIRHVIDVPEPANWDDAFAEAFACRLAWKCGRKLAGSTFDTIAAWREYEKAIADANRVDARENPPLEQEESDWILARLGGDAEIWDPRVHG